MSTAHTTSGAPLALDVERYETDWHPRTGIFVRAVDPHGGFGNHDIADLDRDSLHRWLRSRGGENLWAENVVLQLLGHAPLSDDEVSRG